MQFTKSGLKMGKVASDTLARGVFRGTGKDATLGAQAASYLYVLLLMVFNVAR